MNEEPLIWTSKGNLPVAALEYSHAWEETPDYIKFSETYKLDGEVVKQSCHLNLKHGLATVSDQGKFR